MRKEMPRMLLLMIYWIEDSRTNVGCSVSWLIGLLVGQSVGLSVIIVLKGWVFFFCFFKERIIPGSEFKSADKSGRSNNIDKPNKMENTTKPSPARNDLLITINQFLHSISKALWKSLKSLKGFHNFLAPSNFINYFESLLEL